MIKKIISYLTLIMTIFCCFTTSNMAYASNVLTHKYGNTYGNIRFYDKAMGKSYWMYKGHSGSLSELQINNETAFCVEPNIESIEGAYYDGVQDLKPGMVINKNGDVLTKEQLAQLKNAVFWGWDMNPNKNIEQYNYVKCIVYDILGYNTYDLRGGLSWSKFQELKNFVNDRMDKHTPSWNGESHVVRMGESLTLTDSNGALEYLSLPSDYHGWNIQKSGNTLTFTPTASAENTKFLFKNNHLPAGYKKAQALYVDSNSQHVFRIGDPDYLSGRVNLEVQKEATVRIVKKDTDGNYVPGVTFEVCYYEDFSGTIWEYTTGSDGTVTSPGWKAGDKLYVREKSVPSHLVKSDEVKRIDFQYDRVNEVEFVNTIKYDLKIVKKDTKGNYVPGVTFEVCYYEDFSGTAWKYTTGEDGTVTIPDWKAGKTVYVREVEVPDHLIKSNEVRKVDFKPSIINEVVFVNVPKGDLQITKIDDEGNPVPGVTFEVCYYEDFNGTIWEYTTGEDGNVVSPRWSGQTVYIREKSVPPHLVKSDEVKTVTLVSGEETTVNFTNTIKRGKVQIKKFLNKNKPLMPYRY